MLSSSKEKLNAISNSLPKKRPPKYPHLAEKIEQIIQYFSLNQVQISEKTGIPQASISKCLKRKGSLPKASIFSLSTKLPELIPLWWLTSGPEGGSLQDALAKEKTHAAPVQEPISHEPRISGTVSPEEQALIRGLQTVRSNLANTLKIVDKQLFDLQH